MKYILRLLPYLRPYWKLSMLSVGVLILSSLATLLIPWPLTILVDNVLGDKPLPPLLASATGGLAGNRIALLILTVGAGLFITFLSGGLDVVNNYVNTTINQRIVFSFRSDLLEQTQRLSIPFTDQISIGRLMYAINFEAAASGGVITAIEPLIQGGLTIIGMVVISFRIDPLLALLSILVVPPLYYSIDFYAKHIQPRLLHVKQMEADSLSIIHDTLQMLRVTVAFVREAYEVQRFRGQADRTVDARVDVTVRQAAFGVTVSTMTATGNALVLGFGAWHVLQGQLTTGQLLVVLSYIAAVYKPLQAISTTIAALQDQFVGLDMGFHVLDTRPVVEDPGLPASLDAVKGDVSFAHVHFSYPGRAETLKDISFEVQAGQVVGLVGPTGAGKTTLISLLTRFYDPSDGQILLDGVNIRELPLEFLRSQISLVPQEPLLFSGSVADNIRYGRLDASMDDIMEAARSANSHDFIMRLPQQYETEIGERGARLSGGERQRICVARAFLKNAPVLVLDEPTSSIDSRTEAVIVDALERLMAGRTTFVIAHRLSTVRSADRILVLDRGELVEYGRPDELLQRDGMYRELYAAQSISSTKVAEAEGSPGFWVDWVDHHVPADMEAGAEYRVMASVKNTGFQTWRANDTADGGAVRISYHWLSDGGEVVVWDGLRTALTDDVDPDMMVSADDVAVSAPKLPGAYQLTLSLVQEGVAWCEDLGAPTLCVPVRVTEKVDATSKHQPIVCHKPRIVLLGMIAKTPVAGVVWQTLHYLIGFQRLGFNVTYVEAHAVHPPMFPDSRRAAAFIANVMQRFDLQHQWAFHALHDDGACYGLTDTQLREHCRSASLIINLHGATAPLDERLGVRPLVYLETDPVATQIDLYRNDRQAIDFLAKHDAFFTFGENYGRPDCKLPVTERFAFKPTRQPVVMDFWGPSANGTRDVFTTVGSWNQSDRHPDVQFDNGCYSWSKHFEFLKFIELPRHTDQPFELSLARCNESDRTMLQEHGWRVRDALSFSLDQDAYREYIAESRGEFTVAKDQNIRLRSGWFSDRSATYLAAGRPVINQDTGFGNILPTGAGLFAFSTMEDVLQSVEAIKADYEHHRRAAHAIANEYFNSDVVLRRFLEDVG